VTSCTVKSPLIVRFLKGLLYFIEHLCFLILSLSSRCWNSTWAIDRYIIKCIWTGMCCCRSTRWVTFTVQVWNFVKFVVLPNALYCRYGNCIHMAMFFWHNVLILQQNLIILLLTRSVWVRSIIAKIRCLISLSILNWSHCARHVNTSLHLLLRSIRTPPDFTILHFL